MVIEYESIKILCEVFKVLRSLARTHPDNGILVSNIEILEKLVLLPLMFPQLVNP